MNHAIMSLTNNSTPEDYEFLTPEELLEKYNSGDEEAFCALVGIIGERLLGFITRFTGDFHMAEDVFQTVLLKIATHASSYNGRASVNTWIYTIARNASVDALKANNRYKAIINEEDADINIEDSVDRKILQLLCKSLPAVEKLTVEELGRRIAAAVSALPELQREVFLLREDADLSIDEIAKIVNCSKEAVKSRMRYAVNKLRLNLKKEAKLYGLLDRL